MADMTEFPPLCGGALPAATQRAKTNPAAHVLAAKDSQGSDEDVIDLTDSQDVPRAAASAAAVAAPRQRRTAVLAIDPGMTMGYCVVARESKEILHSHEMQLEAGENPPAGLFYSLLNLYDVDTVLIENQFRGNKLIMQQGWLSGIFSGFQVLDTNTRIDVKHVFPSKMHRYFHFKQGNNHYRNKKEALQKMEHIYQKHTGRMYPFANKKRNHDVADCYLYCVQEIETAARALEEAQS